MKPKLPIREEYILTPTSSVSYLELLIRGTEGLTDALGVVCAKDN